MEAVAAAAVISSVHTPPTGYSVQCYATHAETAAQRRAAQLIEKEKLVLFRSINSSRVVEGQQPLRLDPSLSKYAQDYAEVLYAEDRSPNSNNSGETGPTNSVVVVMAPSGARVARLISPPRIGALACGEMWYGGKYRRHLYNMEGVNEHPENCPCYLRVVFETMTDPGWKVIGIGRGKDGRWIVELRQ